MRPKITHIAVFYKNALHSSRLNFVKRGLGHDASDALRKAVPLYSKFYQTIVRSFAKLPIKAKSFTLNL